jgi:small subunit ribosomal protein S4
MFDRRLQGTVELDPRYLAQYDGTEQSAGRGSGKIGVSSDKTTPPPSAARFATHERARLSSDMWASEKADKEKRTDRGMLLAEPVRRITPYMQMTFAPMERRLDVAIFRAMFASSTLQARQFCVHGAVTVNGKRVRCLNPHSRYPMTTVARRADPVLSISDEIPGLSAEPRRHVPGRG